MIHLILCTLALMPTIDGQRSEWGYHEAPYWLGVSVAPHEIVDVKAIQDGAVLFQIQHGTHTELAWIDNPAPITFYNNDVPIGQIVPEPCTLLMMLTPLLWRRR